MFPSPPSTRGAQEYKAVNTLHWYCRPPGLSKMNSLFQLAHYWSTLPGLFCLILNTNIWQGSEELLVKVRHH